MSETTSQQVATERLFDADGQLVVPAGQPIPDGVSGLKPLDAVSQPADPRYPSTPTAAALVDHVEEPVHDPVTTVPVHTPAEQGLVDQGLMAARDGAPGLSVAPAAEPSAVEAPAPPVQ